MPIERLRMRPWLENALNEHKYPGVEWVDKEAKVFRLPWKHASRNGWQINTDACLFRAWAEHTGKYKSDEKPNPKTWKANFRCALNSLPDMEELTEQRTTKGNNAYKMYKITNNADAFKKGYTSKRIKGRSQRKKRQLLRSRSAQKDFQNKKNNAELITENSKSYGGKSNLKKEYFCNVPQITNTTHLVDHDYAVTRYFDLYNETTDESMQKVFSVPDSTVVKTEPLSPKEMIAEHEFSLYEESALDSKNMETSCTKEDEKIMSDDEVVMLLDEISSDCGSSTSSVDATMDQLLDDLDSYNPLDTDFHLGKKRAHSAPAMLETPFTTVLCPLPSKVSRSKSTVDVHSIISQNAQDFLQSCLSA